MFRASSLALRGLLAIGLMFGFYALAVAVAWGLLYIPYAQVVYLNRLDPKIAFYCVVAAGVVLWSVVPRPDHFEAPGPELETSNQPELFGLLDSVRRATGQKAPKNVYLIPDVNAWVAQRGGFMGIGSRRVMGLGLPLMQVLTVDQLRAVLAHEFGHYYGGDTMLGPWVQKTRMGILRTIGSLGQSWIQLPFIAYARIFFRITNAVSRQQEFAADALAARIAGPQSLADGLKQIHRAAAAFGLYWQNEYVPALHYQVRPPLGEGFASFLLHKQVAARVDTALHQELATAKVDPYDSHPPLPERCAALEHFENTYGGGDTRASVELLNGLPELERDLLGIAVHPELRNARPVRWGDISELVWYPNWRDQVNRQGEALMDMTVGDAAQLCRDPQALACEIVFPPGYLPTSDQRKVEARRVVGVAIAVALVDAGWRMQWELGDPITCTRGEEVLEPLALIAKFESGKLTPDVWREYCDRLGISALRLAPDRGAAVDPLGGPQVRLNETVAPGHERNSKLTARKWVFVAIGGLVTAVLAAVGYFVSDASDPKQLQGRADGGDPSAQELLGVRYDLGDNVPQNYAEAARWYRKAAQQGNVSAQFSLANMYEQGRGVPQDYAEAVRWYRKAADQGDVSAQFTLAIIYNLGKEVPQNYAEAVGWFRKAAEQGNAPAQHSLGLMYYEGHGVPQDYLHAHMWFTLAASKATGYDKTQYSDSRQSVERKMTPQQIAEAQRLAQEWRPRK